MNKFFVIRKDGVLVSAAASLGAAMDDMRTGYLLFMGTPTEALSIRKSLSGSWRANQQNTMPGPRPRSFSDEDVGGTLLAIGLDASGGREL